MRAFLTLRCLCCLVLPAVLCAGRVGAAPFTWNGNGPDNAWSSAGNWSTQTAPPNDGTADLQFDGSLRLTPLTDTAYSVDSLTFNATAGAFVLGGGQITLGVGGIVQNSAATETINNTLVLGAAQTWNINAGALVLGSTAAVNNGGNGLTINAAGGSGATFKGAISGTGGLTVAGSVTLAGANTYTGTTTVSGGALLITGSLNGTAGTALTFANSGSFVAQEAVGKSQGMKTLTFSAGQGVVQSTYGSSGNSALTFSAVPTRTAGATGNFVVLGGTNSTTNRISFTTAPTSGTLLDKGVYFNGADYAAYDAGGYVRAFRYGTGGDATGVTSPGGATFAVGATFGSGSTIGSSSNVNATGSITAQATTTINTLKLSNNSNLTLASSAKLTVNGILQSGNVPGGAIIGGGSGAGVQAASNAELVIRTDGANDALTINAPILKNVTGSNTNALTKTGAGTLTLGGANTYTGVTSVDAGTLTFASGGTLSVAGNVNVAAGATLKIDGGTLSSTSKTLTLDGSSASPANTTVTAGTLRFYTEVVGNNGAGTVTQSGGSHFVGGGLSLGMYAGSTGSYNLGGGTLTTSYEYVGYGGSGTFTQSAGTNTITYTYGSLILGYNGGSGSYTLNGAQAILNTPSEYVGYYSPGTFTQSAGTHTVSGILDVGAETSGRTSFSLSGGTLSVATENVGSNGVGTFTQTGGAHTVSGDLYLSSTGSGVGSFHLGGTNATLAATGEYIGYYGVGTFTQTGGANTVGADGLVLGHETGGNGTYHLSGGTLAAPTESVGYQSAGSFVQTGGTNTLTPSEYNSGSLTVGDFGGAGSYRLDGGTLTAAIETVGNYSTGTFVQNGGLNAVSIVLNLGYQSAGVGTYNLNGGTLQTPAVNGFGGMGTLNFNGGTLQATASYSVFVSALTAANVQVGGAIIDTNGYNPTIPQTLGHDPVLGATADGGLTKIGAGTLTLTGANTYTGPTQVNAGTLLVNNPAGSGTGSGTVTINNGGTLGGIGTVAGPVVVTSGAVLQGGDGSTSGALTLTGNLTLNMGSVIQLALDVDGAHSSLARAGNGTWSFADNQAFAFLNAQTGTYDGIITGLAADPGGEGGWTVTNDGYSGTFQYDGAGNIDLILDVTPVPEPATWLAGALLLAAACWTLRRSRRAPL